MCVDRVSGEPVHRNDVERLVCQLHQHMFVTVIMNIDEQNNNDTSLHGTSVQWISHQVLTSVPVLQSPE
jgi:hypothetical protein